MIRVIRCDMTDDCLAAVAYIDDKGYVYCAFHGEQRVRTRPCRPLLARELARLHIGQTVEAF